MAINWPKRSKKSVKNQFFAICGRTVRIQVFIYSSFERQRWGLSVFEKKFGFQLWVFLWMTKRWPKNQFFAIFWRTAGGVSKYPWEISYEKKSELRIVNADSGKQKFLKNSHYFSTYRQESAKSGHFEIPISGERMRFRQKFWDIWKDESKGFPSVYKVYRVWSKSWRLIRVRK